MGKSETDPSVPRARNESGQYAETVTPDRVLHVFGRVNGPTITSTDVADELGCSTESARRKLHSLSEAGYVEKRKTGRTTVWWLVESTAPPIADPDRDREYLKSFGKYEGTDLRERVEAVGDRLDRDLRERVERGHHPGRE
jgi:predicted ArsR family transcriptional regulator